MTTSDDHAPRSGLPSTSGDPVDKPSAELARRFLPVIVGSRVGDAMGAPTEGLAFEEIDQRFGWVDTFAGAGTDDSLMAALLSEALLRTDGKAGADEWAESLVGHRDEIRRMQGSFFISVLHLVEKLAYGHSPRHAANGNMPSSSSAMCIWPVGLVHAGNPEMAARHAYELAGLVHTGDVDFCQDAAAAVAAAVAAGVRPSTTILEATRIASEAIDRISGQPMRALISRAVALASETSGYEQFRRRYRDEFSRPIECDARETVPAAFAISVLAGGQLDRSVEYAVNFGRDTDTIASIAGALCGAVGGISAIPERWIIMVGAQPYSELESLADQLSRVAQATATRSLRCAASMPGLLPVAHHR